MPTSECEVNVVDEERITGIVDRPAWATSDDGEFLNRRKDNWLRDRRYADCLKERMDFAESKRQR